MMQGCTRGVQANVVEVIALEINYAGSHEEIRRYALLGALASGKARELQEFADRCLAEYDLHGWTADDLINPGDASVLKGR